jgi:hypothetical protein
MDNFLNYITKNLDPEQVDIWFRVNNIIPEKMDLYYDLSYSLYLLIKTTYLGDENDSVETKVKMDDLDNIKHFDWCWNKTMENFKKENISFEEKGEHYDYFLSLFSEIYYKQTKDNVRNSIDVFFNDLFNRDKPFTQVDLDLIYNIYKTLDKNLIV